MSSTSFDSLLNFDLEIIRNVASNISDASQISYLLWSQCTCTDIYREGILREC